MVHWYTKMWKYSNGVKSLISLTGALVEEERLLRQSIFLFKEAGLEENHFHSIIKKDRSCSTELQEEL
ncbi:hypothetical protein JOC77_004171 [Peribacillus deserti]|uniref:Uncharacterized protein n=1 Tax=Peribacillus deserti TaxID=673318 RepID=A0ABS2QPN6_9BACI|nr:hypothetical protein [Peribacillus deserti]